MPRFGDLPAISLRIGFSVGTRELGADFLVQGSLRKIGKRIRLTAQLIQSETGSQTWAERYDRDLTDVFAVQDEITQSVAAALVGQLRHSGTESAHRRPTKSWTAYDYVLRAIEHTNQYATAAANELLRHAIELDPNYALAHAMMAYSHVLAFFEDLDCRHFRGR